ncbi:DUF7547 family protein [Halonotius roseus]|uniref:Uncharacterized protein n=1 Tax=Halonotius roseus TaxID=2511997 RepID=A0A544QQ86_9EURY|nr:hypothetical protein [Halonotius roseus]TQQ81602.1 hypothetical protein EWF95_01275 [Halonotius roseus]
MSPPADSPDRPRDRDELAAQLDELESTLTDLRGELRENDRRGPPQPPRLGDLLRFTEEYTIPTLIAALEATIKSLELLQRTLRLADPARAAREEGEAARSRLDAVGTEAGQQLAGALAELRTALAEADLPEDGDSRDLITDARDLTGEIERRLREAEGTVSDQWDRERDGRSRGRQSNAAGTNDGVMIDVSDDGDDGDGGDDSDDSSRSPAADGSNADAPSVDVDAELESIKDELDEAEQAIDDAERDENPDESTDDDDDTDAT